MGSDVAGGDAGPQCWVPLWKGTPRPSGDGPCPIQSLAVNPGTGDIAVGCGACLCSDLCTVGVQVSLSRPTLPNAVLPVLRVERVECLYNASCARNRLLPLPLLVVCCRYEDGAIAVYDAGAVGSTSAEAAEAAREVELNAISQVQLVAIGLRHAHFARK
jgi:hypothetical protein